MRRRSNRSEDSSNNNWNMRSILSLSTVLILLCNAPSSSEAAVAPFIYQSTAAAAAASSSTYGSAIHFDSRTNLLFVTGSSYSKSMSNSIDSIRGDCFIEVLEVPREENEAVTLFQSMTIGTNNNYEACSGMHLIPSSSSSSSSSSSTGEGKLVVTSHAEEGGILTALRQIGSNKASTYASVIDIDLPQLFNSKSAPNLRDQIRGGRLIHDSAIQLATTLDVYPRSYNAHFLDWTELDSPRDLAIYVGIMSTDNTASNPLFNLSDPNPDITAAGNGGIQPHGVGYTISLKRLQYKDPAIINTQSPFNDLATSNQVKETMTDQWNREYATSDDRDIRLASLLYIPRKSSTDLLLMAGTTRGYGPAFATNQPTSGDLDGFITKIDPNTGDLITGTPKDSLRIESDPGQDETLLALCISPSSQNVDHVYAVGSTRYLMSETLPEQTRPIVGHAWHAYILKLSIDDMAVTWVRQIGSTVFQDKQTDVLGLGCALTHDGKDVYLTGVVKDGGIIPQEDESQPNYNHGGDDIFLASFDADNGAFYFVRQFGTSGHDTPARGEGSLVVDDDGNVMLLGNSNGVITQSKNNVNENENENEVLQSESDYFVIWAERYTGYIKELAEDKRKNPTIPRPPPSSPSSPGNNNNNIPRPSEPTNTFPSSSSSSSSGGGKTISIFGKILMVLLWAGGSICLAGLAFRIFIHRNNLYGIEHEISNDHVSQYLDQEFGSNSDIDIAIRNSATGGIHGMYEFDRDERFTNLTNNNNINGRKNNNKDVPEEVTLSTTPTFGHDDDDNYDEPSVGAHSAPPSFVNDHNTTQSLLSSTGRFVHDDDDDVSMDDDNNNDPNNHHREETLIPIHSTTTTAAGAGVAIQDYDDNEKWGAGYDGLNESWEEEENEKKQKRMEHDGISSFHPKTSPSRQLLSQPPPPTKIPPKSSFTMPGGGRDNYHDYDDDDDDEHEGIV